MLDLHELTSAFYIFNHQIRLIEEGILDTRYRIQESEALQNYIKKSDAQQLPMGDTLDLMPADFSYRLSHQKRLRDWIKDLPEDVRIFEIKEGIALRQKNLYKRSLDSLITTKAFYENIICPK